jgi:hypothetical protein
VTFLLVCAGRETIWRGNRKQLRRSSGVAHDVHKPLGGHVEIHRPTQGGAPAWRDNELGPGPGQPTATSWGQDQDPAERRVIPRPDRLQPPTQSTAELLRWRPAHGAFSVYVEADPGDRAGRWHTSVAWSGFTTGSWRSGASTGRSERHHARATELRRAWSRRRVATSTTSASRQTASASPVRQSAHAGGGPKLAWHWVLAFGDERCVSRFAAGFAGTCEVRHLDSSDLVPQPTHLISDRVEGLRAALNHERERALIERVKELDFSEAQRAGRRRRFRHSRRVGASTWLRLRARRRQRRADDRAGCLHRRRDHSGQGRAPPHSPSRAAWRHSSTTDAPPSVLATGSTQVLPTEGSAPRWSYGHRERREER